MRIEPRKHLLETWKATVEATRPTGSSEWVWGDRDGSNSISDAEQRLRIMLPATDIFRFSLDRPDETDADALEAPRGLGEATQIPRRLVRVSQQLDRVRRIVRDRPASVTALLTVVRSGLDSLAGARHDVQGAFSPC